VSYESRWKIGTYTSEDVRKRINELLGLLNSNAEAWRACGNIFMADEMQELIEVVLEWMRLVDNTQKANQETVRATLAALDRERGC